MMDAGMGLFKTEKPFGIVLGGIKVEMQKHGKVFRYNEIDAAQLPPTTGECDLFLDWSTPFRKRCISCRLEDAGECGKTDEGETVHRYAASFKEGSRNTGARIILVLLLAGIFIGLGIAGIPQVPRTFTILAGIALGTATVYCGLMPSLKARKTVRKLIETVKEGK